MSDTLYGIPQDRFIGAGQTLYEKTYSSVRGEELIILIEKIVEFLNNHVHTAAGVAPDEKTLGSLTSKTAITQLLNNANANSRAQNFPKHIEVNPNAQRVQQTGFDYLKPSNVVPVSTFTQENPSINYGKVQGKGRNVNPS